MSTRDAKLIQYLNEAYGKEKELEVALQAHIALTTRMPYKKRLREHVTETKAHGREVAKRIKQLGGRRRRDSQAGSAHPARRGAYGEVSRAPDRDAGSGRRQRGGSRPGATALPDAAPRGLKQRSPGTRDS
jgi:hypothetical protein